MGRPQDDTVQEGGMMTRYPNNLNVPMSTRWSRHRAQAKYRGEAYELTLDEYRMLWATQGITDRHQHTGRRSDSVSMVRINPQLPWRVNNITFMTRGEYTTSFRNRYSEFGYMRNR